MKFGEYCLLFVFILWAIPIIYTAYTLPDSSDASIQIGYQGDEFPYKEDFMEKLTEQYGESASILGWDEQEYGVVYVAIEENDKTHIGVWDYLDKWWF